MAEKSVFEFILKDVQDGFQEHAPREITTFLSNFGMDSDNEMFQRAWSKVVVELRAFRRSQDVTPTDLRIALLDELSKEFSDTNQFKSLISTLIEVDNQSHKDDTQSDWSSETSTNAVLTQLVQLESLERILQEFPNESDALCNNYNSKIFVHAYNQEEHIRETSIAISFKRGLKNHAINWNLSAKEKKKIWSYCPVSVSQLANPKVLQGSLKLQPSQKTVEDNIGCQLVSLLSLHAIASSPFPHIGVCVTSDQPAIQQRVWDTYDALFHIFCAFPSISVPIAAAHNDPEGGEDLLVDKCLLSLFPIPVSVIQGFEPEVEMYSQKPSLMLCIDSPSCQPLQSLLAVTPLLIPVIRRSTALLGLWVNQLGASYIAYCRTPGRLIRTPTHCDLFVTQDGRLLLGNLTFTRDHIESHSPLSDHKPEFLLLMSDLLSTILGTSKSIDLLANRTTAGLGDDAISLQATRNEGINEGNSLTVFLTDKVMGLELGEVEPFSRANLDYLQSNSSSLKIVEIIWTETLDSASLDLRLQNSKNGTIVEVIGDRAVARVEELQGASSPGFSVYGLTAGQVVIRVLNCRILHSEYGVRNGRKDVELLQLVAFRVTVLSRRPIPSIPLQELEHLLEFSRCSNQQMGVPPFLSARCFARKLAVDPELAREEWNLVSLTAEQIRVRERYERPTADVRYAIDSNDEDFDESSSPESRDASFRYGVSDRSRTSLTAVEEEEEFSSAEAGFELLRATTTTTNGTRPGRGSFVMEDMRKARQDRFGR